MPESVKHNLRRLRRLDGRIESRPGDDAHRSVALVGEAARGSHAWGNFSNALWPNSSPTGFGTGRGFVVLAHLSEQNIPPRSRHCGRECARHPAQNCSASGESCWRHSLSPLPAITLESNQATSWPGLRNLFHERASAKKALSGHLSSWRYDISGLAPEMRVDYEAHLAECNRCHTAPASPPRHRYRADCSHHLAGFLRWVGAIWKWKPRTR